MSDISINSYAQTAQTYANTGQGGNSLNIDDFLNLISAQLQNQDMMNPMNDTEFIAQLAQFTALQISQSMAENQNISMALNFVGKEVKAVSVSSTGKLEEVTGVVEKVTLYEGTPMVYIGEKKFSVFQIMEMTGGKSSGEDVTPPVEPEV